MTIITQDLKISSKREGEMIDITIQISELVKKSGIRDGNVIVFVSGSTAALTTIEFEPGLQKDFPQMLERIVPSGIEYAHEQMWHDGNGHSHIKASLIGPSLTIPFTEGHLLLGRWQQIVMIELDTRPRNRNLVLQILGE